VWAEGGVERYGVAMAFRQEAFWIVWEPNTKTWRAEVDGQSVRGAWSSIIQKLTEGGWEIVAVTPMHWFTDHGNKGPGLLDDSATMVDLVAMIAKKTI
jgi:allophanate hydrolase subunit 1